MKYFVALLTIVGIYLLYPMNNVRLVSADFEVFGRVRGGRCIPSSTWDMSRSIEYKHNRSKACTFVPSHKSALAT